MASNRFFTQCIAKEFAHNMIGNFTEPASLAAYRKMLYYRCNNLGMKELDVSLGKWAYENTPNMTLEECRQFETQVLDLETPDLFKLILNANPSEQLRPMWEQKYIKILREYAMNGMV